jgi:uncharacterized protein YjbI with pentapeptide repeats
MTRLVWLDRVGAGLSGDILAMAGSDEMEPVSRQPGRRGRPASDEIPQSWVFWSVAAGLALGLLIVVLAQVWPLPHHGQHMSFPDAFDIAWKVALFPPGIVTARIAVDRINLSSREHQHAIEVARSSELDATQRRITELSAKASDQLGSDKPTVRIGGLTDLERLGQNNPDLRQTVADRICAYLQMPFDLPELSQGEHEGDQPQAHVDGESAPGQDGSLAARQERKVRQTAQRILTRHTKWSGDVEAPPSTFWPGISIDLSEATLVDFDMRDCRIAGADFTGAVIHGTADFNGAEIAGSLSFADAIVTENADFTSALIGGPADFCRAAITAYAAFAGATIRSSCSFSHATIGHADFSNAALRMGADFQKVRISGHALFARTTVDGDADFRLAEIDKDAIFRDATLRKHVLLAGATVGGGVDFSGSTVTGGASFRGAKIHEMARFREATIGGVAGFENATMYAGADFGDATIGGPADFVNATAHGDVSFRGATFGRGEFRGVKLVGTADFTGAQMSHIVLGDGSRTEITDTSLLGVDPDTRRMTMQMPGTAKATTPT